MVIPKSLLDILKNNPRCIYKLVNPAGNIYIGQTICLYKRIMKYKNLTCKAQPILYNSLKKYGFYNHEFSIIETFDEGKSRGYINEREKYFIEIHRVMCNKMLNIHEGGQAGTVSYETRVKMSASRLGKKPWNKGIKTGLTPANKGKTGVRNRYVYYKDGKEVVVDDIIGFCKTNNLEYTSMLRVQSGKGSNGMRGEYKGYTKDKNWIEPLKKYAKGADHPTAKFTPAQVQSIRGRRKLGDSAILLSKEFGVNEETIRNCVKRKTYKNAY